MSEERPHYHAAVIPDTEWDEGDDARFDGAIGYLAGKRYPAAPYEVVDTSHLSPPLDPRLAPSLDPNQHILKDIWLLKPNVYASLHRWGWTILANGGGLSMDKHGEWYIVPSPSRIDDEWIKDHYFSSLSVAIVVATDHISDLPRHSPVLDLLFAIDELIEYVLQDVNNGIQIAPGWQDTANKVRGWIEKNKIFDFSAEEGKLLRSRWQEIIEEPYG